MNSDAKRKPPADLAHADEATAPGQTQSPQSPSLRGAPRPGGRSARVVRAVLEATLEEFAETGYAGLSVEAVATRAKVNKTTVYRRWPTKAGLVEAALFSLRDQDAEAPDTGSLRGDLLAILRQRAARVEAPRWRAIMNALATSTAEPELSSIVIRLKRERPAIPAVVWQRAQTRGEVTAGLDTALLTEVLIAPLHVRAYWKRQPLNEQFVEALVDLVLRGCR